MSNQLPIKTPGVYINELDSFPQSIIGVSTAIPAFVGYTEKVEHGGESILMKPVMITSLLQFEEWFGRGPELHYTLVEVGDKDDPDLNIYDPAAQVNRYYAVVEDRSAWKFNLYKGIRLFFENGGTECFVVSVGDYTTREGELQAGVSGASLEGGLDAIADFDGPTLVLLPDALLLPNDDPEGDPWQSSQFVSLTQKTLRQCADRGDRFAILDIYGSSLVPSTNENMGSVFEAFRQGIGNEGLSYGAAYFPLLETTVVSLSEIGYLSFTPESRGILKELLTWQNAALNNGGTLPPEGEQGSAKYEMLQVEIAKVVENDLPPEEVAQVNQTLTGTLPILQQLLQAVVKRENILPPSSAVAGLYVRVDSSSGVWTAPAGMNAGLESVIRPTILLNDSEQGEMNVPAGGRAINAIRTFPGIASVVWGARTLDGNSNDWRYIQVRRTLIYIEQSIKNALQPFVFAANSSATWSSAVSMIEGFLNSLWKEGGLIGSTPSDAYSVECGLGSTMTQEDILNGYMIVQVMVSVVYPAEFIVLMFRQKMDSV
ncbi:MAG: phage tail sheath family protein [Ignavibacteriae bacterium]|nr:phage tail sheath family protein [Ignavibacteriota bacterium]MCB9214417.1 phage tail sheath family protein [Ignavibacteria bacterium]